MGDEFLQVKQEMTGWQ